MVALTRQGVVSTAQQKMAVFRPQRPDPTHPDNDAVVRVGVRFGCIADLVGRCVVRTTEEMQDDLEDDQFLTTTTSTVHD